MEVEVEQEEGEVETKGVRGRGRGECGSGARRGCAKRRKMWLFEWRKSRLGRRGSGRWGKRRI